jgi:four helix bundle protein
MQRFTELKVWQRSHQLTLEMYRVTASFPSAERFGLISQLRRAAASVPTNIAEGSKRQSNQEYARFLNIAEASLVETEYLLMLSRDLGLLAQDSSEVMLQEVTEIAKMLSGLRRKVELSAAASESRVKSQESKVRELSTLDSRLLTVDS